MNPRAPSVDISDTSMYPLLCTRIDMGDLSWGETPKLGSTKVSNHCRPSSPERLRETTENAIETFLERAETSHGFWKRTGGEGGTCRKWIATVDKRLPLISGDWSSRPLAACRLLSSFPAVVHSSCGLLGGFDLFFTKYSSDISLSLFFFFFKK